MSSRKQMGARLKSRTPKILFIHNTAVWYRKPFFRRLSEKFNVKFVFTDIQVQKEVYGVHISDKIEGLDGVNYRVLENFRGISAGLIEELLGYDCDVIIDSLGEREALLSFVVAKLRRKSIIFWSEDWGWKGKSLPGITTPRVIRFILAHSDAILVPGTKHKEYLISLGALPSRVFIMPNVSNLVVKQEHYHRKEELKEKLNLEGKKTVLYVGRLVKRKGVDYLIRAFAKLIEEANDAVLIIVGDGECKGELEQLSKSLNTEDYIHFIGAVDNMGLPSYYLLCDVCVVPSITYGIGDPWVFVVNEAMLCGKPVIATDAVGAAFDMIKHGENGFIVPEGEVNRLYEAMKTILSDASLKERMGEESKRIIENGFKYEHMVEGFRNALKFVCG